MVCDVQRVLQLQMQAGVTGINALRVYSVTKQALDQDKFGTFIRKWIPELEHHPTNFIHVRCTHLFRFPRVSLPCLLSLAVAPAPSPSTFHPV